MFIKLYLIALPVFFAIDMLWIGVVARGFYARELGALMTSNVNWVAAICFYLLFIAGLIFFVVSPSLENQSLTRALLAGAFFGLVTYATYDLTNLATLRDWPLLMTFVDLAWGTFLGGTVSAATYLLAAKYL